MSVDCVDLQSVQQEEERACQQKPASSCVKSGGKQRPELTTGMRIHEHMESHK